MGRANPIDAHVGARLRQRRAFLGMSQEKLARSLGLTFQQIQKYERGANRIGAGRLYQLAAVLDVPVAYFYAGIGPDGFELADARAGDSPAAAGQGAGLADDAASFDGDLLTNRETLDLVRAYYRLRSPKLRRRVLDLVRSIEFEVVEAERIESAVMEDDGPELSGRRPRRQS